MKGLATILCFAGIMTGITANSQTCALISPANMIVKAEKGQEGAIVTFADPASLVTGDCGAISYTPASGSFFRIGSHSVIVSTPSGQKTFFTLTVTDNEPPYLSELTLSARKLVPAKNKMKKIGVYYTASDNAQEVNTSISVTSNHDSPGTRDAEVVDKHMVKLYSAPLPDGETRVYTITVTCTDAAGNITRRATTVTVPGSSMPSYTVNNEVKSEIK